MATYVVGDIQGCYDSLRLLLEKVSFDPRMDQLWCAGDLVNRGPDSLQTLRYLHSLGDASVCVLGNHDIHLLEHAAGKKEYPRDTLRSILEADDATLLLDWLRSRPLLHRNKHLGLTMIHAGLSPLWTLKKAMRRAHKLELVLQSKRWLNFCSTLSATPFPEVEPKKGDPDRLLFSLAVLTNARYCSQQGRFNWGGRGDSVDQNIKLERAWYLHSQLRWKKTSNRIVFGHWAALGLVVDQPHVLGLDSGCVWGGRLTLARVDCRPFRLISVDCPACLEP